MYKSSGAIQLFSTSFIKQYIRRLRIDFALTQFTYSTIIKVKPLPINRVLAVRSVMPAIQTAKVIRNCVQIIHDLLT